MIQKKSVTITAPNIQTVVFEITGDTPYVQNKFSAGSKGEMRTKQEAGSTSRKGRKREPKDFDACYKAAIHYSTEGWAGIPAPAFRSAMISACRLAGFQMTKAKLTVFVRPDGFDATDGTPLVKITAGEPHYHEAVVRISMGTTDIRPRPMWNPGWKADVRISFDADMFTLDDVANLMHRAGLQVGIGEGRPDSKTSNGQGWGLFSITNQEAD